MTSDRLEDFSLKPTPGPHRAKEESIVLSPMSKTRVSLINAGPSVPTSHLLLEANLYKVPSPRASIAAVSDGPEEMIASSLSRVERN